MFLHKKCIDLKTTLPTASKTNDDIIHDDKPYHT